MSMSRPILRICRASLASLAIKKRGDHTTLQKSSSKKHQRKRMQMHQRERMSIYNHTSPKKNNLPEKVLKEFAASAVDPIATELNLRFKRKRSPGANNPGLCFNREGEMNRIKTYHGSTRNRKLRQISQSCWERGYMK